MTKYDFIINFLNTSAITHLGPSLRYELLHHIKYVEYSFLNKNINYIPMKENFEKIDGILINDKKELIQTMQFKIKEGLKEWK